MTAEFPLTEQLVSMVVPRALYSPPPPPAEFPLTEQLVSVAVPLFFTPPPAARGGVSADGAIGQCGHAAIRYACHHRRWRNFR